MARAKKSGRRDSNTGAIYKDGDGYRVAVLIGYDSATGKPKYKKVRAKTHEEAIDSLRRLQRDQDSGKLVSTKGVTVSTYLDAWLKTIEANRAPSTHRQYFWLVEAHIKPNLGKKQLDKVTRKDIQLLLAAKANQKISARDKARASEPTETLSANTLRLIRAVLHAAYRDAMRDGLTGRNPVELVELPNSKAPSNTKTKFLTAEQLSKLQAECAKSDIGNLVLFMMHTGTRLGEATGIRWQDIDLGSSPHVRICGQLQRLGGKLQYRPTTKTNRVRAIPLSATIADTLKNLKAFQLVSGPQDSEGIVFLNLDGNRIDPKFANLRIKALCRTAGIPEVSAHAIRHSFATLVLAETGDLHAAQKLLGHSQVALTANLYAHATAETLRPAISALDRLNISQD